MTTGGIDFWKGGAGSYSGENASSRSSSPLADNGGPALTHTLGSGGPAVDAAAG